MDEAQLENSLCEVLRQDNHRDTVHGEYHPSQISGCPLKVFLDRMTDNYVELNSWLFQGTAVHYYLQETGLLDDALHRAGYHFLDTDYEVNTHYRLEDDIFIVGTCDIICHDGDSLTIFDIKYSTLKAEYNHPRLLKYYSQANTYAHMFGADEYALILINSKSREFYDDISVLSGTVSEENWDLVTKKARQIHSALEAFDYDDGDRLLPKQLNLQNSELWSMVMEYFDQKDIPSYDKECKWCDHSEYCPVKNGEVESGLASFKGGVD